MNMIGLLIYNKPLSIISNLSIYTSKLALYFPFILFIIMVLFWIVIAYRLGDWKNWKHYYPTILFFWCGDLIYNVVFYKKPLWTFTNPIFSHLITDFICAAVIFTCTVLVFLPRYPNGFASQIKYLAFWAFVYSAVEWIFYLLKGISYDNGWNLGYSIIHNIYQFTLLRIHHKNPILAWILALVILVIMANIFAVSLGSSQV